MLLCLPFVFLFFYQMLARRGPAPHSFERNRWGSPYYIVSLEFADEHGRFHRRMGENFMEQSGLILTAFYGTIALDRAMPAQRRDDYARTEQIHHEKRAPW
jgi:hypothetical protein